MAQELVEGPLLDTGGVLLRWQHDGIVNGKRLRHRVYHCKRCGHEELSAVAMREHVCEGGLADENQEGLLYRPPTWEVLSETAKWQDEVEWVHQNRLRVIVQGKAGPKFYLGRARSQPPSEGSIALMETAAHADLKFTELLHRAKVGGDDGEKELVKVERKSIGEIERVLAGMMEVRG